MLSTQEPLSVSKLTRIIKTLIEDDDRLASVYVEGEISGFRPASSGHVYFSLKDSKSLINAAMWKQSAQRMGSYRPADGDQVIAYGHIEVYEPRGNYQLIVERIEPKGLGQRFIEYERLRQQFIAEGLFDEARKRTLPDFPMTIGVVTSRDGAALQDVLKVLRRRFPLGHVIVSHTLVQGEDAPPQIVRAIQRINRRDDVDVLILCRGGGSLEDLWAFNDERVVRAVAASRIPTIAGVGHETDTTLVDFAADERAPTPSAAAERVSPDLETVQATLDAMRRTLNASMLDAFTVRADALARATRSLERESPAARINTLRQQLDDLTLMATRLVRGRLLLARERVHGRQAALLGRDPYAPLAKGYALVRRHEDGALVTRAGDISPGDALSLELRDGRADVRAE